MRILTNEKGRFIKSFTTEERFYSKVIKTNYCWLWTGYKIRGYGHFWDGSYLSSGNAKMVKAHRWSYENNIGEIPNGLLVCHTCDNPTCVNPAHLFIGTHDDNMRDKFLKGRNCYGDKNGSRSHIETKPRGENHCKAKLSDIQVREILKKYKDGGVTQKQLAEQYGVTQTCISNYIIGHSRKIN